MTESVTETAADAAGKTQSAPETRATTVAIAGLGMWIPGYPNATTWQTRRRDPECPKPTGLSLDRINRRRAGIFARAIADAAAEAIAHSNADAAQVPIVVGSSIGEASTMIGLLEQMWRTKTPMSPASFSISVHNAASGLLSISSKNQGYTTSLAADENTPAVALMEGIGLVLQQGEPVLVVCADESAPVCLVKDAATWDLLAAAVVLAPVGSDYPCLAQLDIVRNGEITLEQAPVDRALTENPQIGFMDFIDAILRKSPGHVALDRGTGHGYLAKLTFGDS